jgi:PAS domain S-box-containing protein
MMSFIFLAVPSLLVGMFGYQSSANSLNALGAQGLQTDVRMTIEMINTLQKQVKAGKISIRVAQEEVKEAILGKKNANGTRPINPRLNLGKHGFLFIINDKGLEIVHPNFEGQNVWNVKTIDGVHSTQEIVKAANRGGGFVTYEWPLPDHPHVQEPKMTYAEKDPNWNWIVCAGAYLPDFNAGAHRVLYVLLITLGLSLLAGAITILLFSKKLTKPILLVAEHAKLIANGDYTHDPIDTSSKDEIGELVKNFNIMKENQRKAEEQIRQHEEFLQSITTHMGEGMVVMDAQGRMTFMNPEAERILGWTKEECINQNLHDLIHLRQDGTSFPYEACPSTNSSLKGEVYRIGEDWFVRKNGSLSPVSYVTSPLFENGNVTGAIVVFRDITKQKADQEKIEYMAFHDELTKLPNLRYLKEKLKKDLFIEKPFTLLILDIDRFKHINEGLGYAFGDLILQSVSNRLKEQLPSGVFFGRLTGDEFAIIYPSLNRVMSGSRYANRFSIK